jgi:hypothetical protein
MVVQHADPPHPVGLCARGERPSHHTAEQRAASWGEVNFLLTTPKSRARVALGLCHN